MIHQVSEITGISVAEILGSGKKPTLALIRRAYWLLLRVNDNMTNTEMAEMCNVNPSTVSIGIKKMREELTDGDIFALFIWDKLKDIKPYRDKHSKADVRAHLEKYLK